MVIVIDHEHDVWYLEFDVESCLWMKV